MFFFLPIVFGCPTRIAQEGDPTARICPKCKNASVVRVNSRSWFELCFIPLIPMKKEHLWWCSICQWNVPLQPQWEPAFPGYGWNGPQYPLQGSPISPPPDAHGYQAQHPNTPVQKHN